MRSFHVNEVCNSMGMSDDLYQKIVNAPQVLWLPQAAHDPDVHWANPADPDTFSRLKIPLLFFCRAANAIQSIQILVLCCRNRSYAQTVYARNSSASCARGTGERPRTQQDLRRSSDVSITANMYASAVGANPSIARRFDSLASHVKHDTLHSDQSVCEFQ